MKWRAAIAAAFLFAAGILGASASADAPVVPVVRAVGPGNVDWAERTVKVLGVAPPFVKSATVVFAPEAPDEVARADAARKMLTAVQAIRTRGGVTVAELARTDGELLVRLDGVARAFEIGPVRRFSDGGIEVVARISLDAVIAALRARAPAATGMGASGLVIDATAARAFVPCVLPSLATSTGVLLADGSAAAGWRYAGTTKAARALLGDPKAPIAKAAGVTIGNETELVLSATEAARLDTWPGAGEALRSGRVVVVVGKPLPKK